MTTITEIQTVQVYQVFIKATAEQIWDAITQPEFTEKYFYGARADYELRAGGRYRSLSADGDLLTDGEVIEASPPHKLVHTWRSLWSPEQADEESSRLTWEIEPNEAGVCKLTVVHDQLEGAPKTAESVAGGWMFILSGLKTLLETGKPLA
jgi:uncharacterized protein YndB with AHSA1/START domain